MLAALTARGPILALVTACSASFAVVIAKSLMLADSTPLGAILPVVIVALAIFAAVTAKSSNIAVVTLPAAGVTGRVIQTPPTLTFATPVELTQIARAKSGLLTISGSVLV